MSDERFWEVVDEYLVTGRLQEGTIMGHTCVRTVEGNEFVAMGTKEGGLIVKLPKDRVAGLVESGEGASFAPAGRVFREWVEIATFDADEWSSLIEESIDFVG